MKPIYLKVIFNRKKVATSKHEAAVEIRLSQDRRTLYYNTGVRLLPKHWHDGQVVNRIDAAELQQTIDICVKHVRKTINTLMDGGSCQLDDVMAKLRQSDFAKTTFIDFCEQRAEIRSYGRSSDSRERYQRFLRYLLKFGQITTFSDINDENILAMDADLASTGMKNYSKWQNYHRFLNSFILDAIDAGYLTRNPYRWLHIEKDKSSGGIGKYLTKKELDKIRFLDPPTDSLKRVRDLFVFQTYTCLSYVDMANFDADKIRYINNLPVYQAQRGKTNQAFAFVILPDAMEVLERYHKRLPIISNVKYNQYLKVLALMAGISKPISSHWARHTGATLLLNEGELPMEIVAKILGHSSTKITRQVYAKLLDETVAEAMVSAVEKLK